MPQDEYRGNMLQLKVAAIPTTAPNSAIHIASNTNTTMVHTASVPLYMKNVFTMPLCPVRELLDNYKGISIISAQSVPDLPSLKVVERNQGP